MHYQRGCCTWKEGKMNCTSHHTASVAPIGKQINEDRLTFNGPPLLWCLYVGGCISLQKCLDNETPGFPLY